MSGDFDLRQHEAVIEETIRKAYRREGRTSEPVTHITPLSEMIEREQAGDDDEVRIKSEGVDAWLHWIFEDGPHPSKVMRRLYAFTRAIRPDLILNMPGADLSAMFAQTRAAESARVKMMIGGTFAKAGYRSQQLPFQKSASAVETFRKCAKGNKHRANSVKKKKQEAAA